MIEVLKQALEALENEKALNESVDIIVDATESAITSLRQLIADLEKQEPVAWSYWQSCLNDDGTQTAPWIHCLSKYKPSESIINKDIKPLYTSPQLRKPLTDEQIEKLAEQVGMSIDKYGLARDAETGLEDGVDAFGFARAIEQAHGIKE